MRCSLPAFMVMCLLARLASGQSIPVSEASNVAHIVSDAQNQVWATFHSQGARLLLLKEDQWMPVELPGFPSTLRPLAMTRLKDVAIACLWRDESTAEDHVISRHTLTKHTILARIPEKLKDPRMLALADGGVLVLESGRHLLRIGKGGDKPEVSTLPEDVFFPPKKNDDGSVSTTYLPLHAVEDQRGMLWLWSASMQKQEFQWRLRGLAKLKSGSLSFEKIRGCKEEDPISIVAPWLDDRLAIAVAGVGLFSRHVDKSNFVSYEGVEDLKYIERIFRAGGDWHLVTTPQPSVQSVQMSKTFRNQIEFSTQRFYDPQKRSSALFRMRKTEMSPLTWKLDSEPLFGWPTRPLLETQLGFWIGVKEGAVFVPFAEKSKPQLHPSGRVIQLLAVGKDRMIALEDTGGTFLLNAKPAPPAESGPKRVEVLKTESLLLEDAQGRVWGRMADKTMQRWEHGKWSKIDVPEKVLQMTTNVFMADAHNQGWLISMKAGAAAVCDFSTGAWQSFDSLEDALVARMRPSSRLLLRDFPSLAPVSSATGHGFLRHEDGSLHHYDGRKWVSWKISDLAGADARATSAPAFDKNGRFSITINDHLWQLMPSGQWQMNPHSAEAESVHHSNESRPPPGCPIKTATSTAYDRFGICWLSDDQRRLWKCIHGQAVPVSQPNEPDPLRGGATLYEVRSDLDGNAFIRLKFGWHGERYLAVRTRLPQPTTTASTKEIIADTARLSFGNATWHSWRIDSGPWSQATDQKEFTLTALLPGKHEIEVLAYNDDLTPAKASVKLQFTIQAAAVQEIDQLIAKLGGADLDANEDAARRLRSQGANILPLLRQKHEKANEQARWWIEAVIQHIESLAKRP